MADPASWAVDWPGARGWAAAVLYVSLVGVALVVAVRRHQRWPLGPADLVTLVRVGLIGAVTVLVAEGGPAGPVVAVASVALVLDWVDGRVARGTRTESDFGARFDMEADAFLILALSVYASGVLGAWVLLIGAMRYLFGAAALTAPWLRGPLPPSTARKTVAAAQGIVLTVVASGVLPLGAAEAVTATALAALLWSFGRDVVGLWRARAPGATTTERKR
ncbi:CDP-alcohol phosphatidyltransferase family protein [Nocardiopsis sp. NPDC007018]|uniref:CDP-alcohol phosphatidyltransferase family protein n=1 Tax=Nocardiopsis sp. NPDC007018 TaxID=3155721 RepID=UPI003406E2FB